MCHFLLFLTSRFLFQPDFGMVKIQLLWDQTTKIKIVISYSQKRLLKMIKRLTSKKTMMSSNKHTCSEF